MKCISIVMMDTFLTNTQKSASSKDKYHFTYYFLNLNAYRNKLLAKIFTKNTEEITLHAKKSI